MTISIDDISIIHPTVAEVVADRLEQLRHRKTQADVAREVGLPKPNVITMIKQGKTKLPAERIGPFALALEIDPVYLYSLVTREYEPETWEHIKSIISTPILTATECQIIAALRTAGVSTRRILPSDVPSMVRAIGAATLTT